MLFVNVIFSPEKVMHIKAIMMKFALYLPTRIYALIFNYGSMCATVLVDNYGRKTNNL